MFEVYYTRHFARRLLHQMSRSDDSEQRMISTLRSECGWQFINKLEAMFREITQSNSLNEELWGQFTNKNLTGVDDLNVKVLSTSYWPGLKDPSPIILPRVLSQVGSYYNLFNSWNTWYTTDVRCVQKPLLGEAFWPGSDTASWLWHCGAKRHISPS